MEDPDTIRAIIANLSIVMVMIATAFFASGLVSEAVSIDEPTFSVELENIATDGLGGTVEHSPLQSQVVEGIIYDIGVRMIALDEDEAVRVYFSLTRPNISLDDLTGSFYYDTVSGNWRVLSFSDRGDTLVALLGPSGGLDIAPGDEMLFRLLLSFDFDGNVTPSCWAEGG